MPGFLQFDQETYLARRLSEHGTEVIFNGPTDTKTRRERMRNAIITNNLAHEVIGTIGGKPETYGELFKRIYREPLHTMRGIYDAHTG